MHASMLMMFEYALLLIIGVCLEKKKRKESTIYVLNCDKINDAIV